MLRTLLQRLPTGVRHSLMRRMFRFDPDRCNQIEVRYAQTPEEYRQAFEVLFAAYEAVGFFQGGNNPRAQQARALYYAQAALPTSTVLVAIVDGRVVGTTTLIRDTSMGLAADELLGARKAGLTSRGERISELSMLAVAKGHRKGGEVLFALLRYAAMIYMGRERADLAVCTTNAVLADALMGLMLFHRVTEPFRHPKSRAVAIGLYVDFRDIEERARVTYRGAARTRDLARFFFDEGRARVRLPDSLWITTTLPKLQADQWPAAFGSPADMHEAVSPAQLLVLRNALSPRMRAALGDWVPKGEKPDRATRYDTFATATVGTARDGRKRDAVLVQASEGGAMFTTDEALQVGDEVILEARVATDRVSTVRGRVLRIMKGSQHVIALSQADETWTEYLSALEAWLWGQPATSQTNVSPEYPAGRHREHALP